MPVAILPIPAIKMAGVAVWDGFDWYSLTPNETKDTVPVLTVLATAKGVYAGGTFTSIDGVAANGIALWKDDKWHALGEGLNGEVWAIEQVGDHIYAAGEFTKSGTTEVNNIAMWDGVKWNGLNGGGVNDHVNDLLFDGEYLWVAGDFKQSGEIVTGGGLARYKIEPVGVDEEPTPSSFTLSQNYPNPFNPSTKIGFTLSRTQQVSVRVFDVLGQHISTLFDGIAHAGTHTIEFTATELTSGVYFYRIDAAEGTQIKKMILMK